MNYVGDDRARTALSKEMLTKLQDDLELVFKLYGGLWWGRCADGQYKQRGSGRIVQVDAEGKIIKIIKLEKSNA